LSDPAILPGAIDGEHATDLQAIVAPPAALSVDELRRWFEDMVRGVAPGRAGATLRLTTDEEVADLNARYRDKPGPTDVLSFPGEETPEGHPLGDIVIALGVAERQAQAAGHNLDRELRVLSLHGVLHCLGYDHETDDGEMGKLELELRQRWVDGRD
jgi:probable rRNA maturation factor